jgi:hypothetical protein
VANATRRLREAPALRAQKQTVERIQRMVREKRGRPSRLRKTPRRRREEWIKSLLITDGDLHADLRRIAGDKWARR